MTLGQIETIDGIDACLLAGYTGQYAAKVYCRKSCGGDVNPGVDNTADTWAYDFNTAASYANAGKMV